MGLIESCVFGRSEKRYVLLVGMPGSGKTTILYGSKLTRGWEVEKFKSTSGFNYEEFDDFQPEFAVFDTPGNEFMEELISTLYNNIPFSAIIFVMEATENPMNYIEARRKIFYYCNEPALKNCLLAVVVNVKTSVPTYQNVAFLTEALGFDDPRIEDKIKKIFIISPKFEPKKIEEVFYWFEEKMANE